MMNKIVHYIKQIISPRYYSLQGISVKEYLSGAAWVVPRRLMLYYSRAIMISLLILAINGFGLLVCIYFNIDHKLLSITFITIHIIILYFAFLNIEHTREYRYAVEYGRNGIELVMIKPTEVIKKFIKGIYNESIRKTRSSKTT